MARREETNVPLDASIPRGHFFYSSKSFQSPAKIPKSRFVEQGYNDRGKFDIIHNSSTVGPSFIRVISLQREFVDFVFFHVTSHRHTLKARK